MKSLLRSLLLLITINSACVSASASASASTVPDVAPLRLVVLSPFIVELLYEIGAGDHIVGTVEYADFPAAANQIPRIGRYDFIDFEALLLLQPDVVLLSPAWTSSLLRSRLQQLGFRTIDIKINQLADIPEQFRELGKLTQNTQQAMVIAEQFSTRLTALKRQYQHLAPVRIFYQVWPMPLTTSASTWLNEILSGCGGHNVFANSINEYPQISTEQVLAVMPELIVKPLHSNQEPLDNWHNWPELPAVVNNQIVSVDSSILNRTGPRILDGMALMCQIIDTTRTQKQQSNQGKKV